MPEIDKIVDVDENTDVAVPEPDKNPVLKKKRNKWLIPGIVVAVIAVLAIGFTVWHNTPGFCNAICHKPMDPYVQSVTSGDEGMMVTAHFKAKLSCLDCHEAKLTEQVSEAMAWIADEFATDENGKLVPSVDFASEQFCARKGCHDMSTVIAETRGFEGNAEQYNPHSSHQDLALACGDCHKAHTDSVLVCNDCHALNAPEGWEA